jgi:hypothetical protein
MPELAHDPVEIADQVRALADAVDDPDAYRVLIPEDVYDRVKARLDTATDFGRGRHHHGVSLCFTGHWDEPRVEFKRGLESHLEMIDATPGGGRSE